MTKDELICAVSAVLIHLIKAELPGVIVGYDKEGDVINIFDEVNKSLVSVGVPGLCSAFMSGAAVEEITADIAETYFALITADSLAQSFARHFPNVILVKGRFEPAD